MRRKRLIVSVATVAVAGTAVALTVPALAETSGPPPGDASELRDPTDPGVDPRVVAAVGRALTLGEDQVHDRLRRERWASRTEPTLRADLGTRYGGSWFDPATQQLVIGVTDDAAAGRVRSTGAEPKIVSRGEAELNQLKQNIDQNREKAPQSITSWYVDPATNSVVVVAKPGAENAASTLAAASGVPAAAVRVETSTQAPTPLFDVRGGDAFFINSRGRCSIGFAVKGGFVTAGHCGKVGATTTGTNRAAQGTFKISSFPGNDYAFVEVNSSWTPTPVVNDFDGGTVAVAGSQEAAIGATVCRSGSTTGTHCGLIQARNVTVNYAEGAVSGLTRTSVCAEPGDSGGSWLSGSQAQGVTSGGSGNCTTGGTTFFQPVNEILTANNLTLVTSSSGQTPPPTSPSATSSATRSSSATRTTAPPTSTATGKPTTKPTATATSTQPGKPTTKPTGTSHTPSVPGSTGPVDPSQTASVTPPGTTPPGTNPPGTNPPGTNPPSTSPPATNPPASGSCTGFEATQSGTLAGGQQRTIPRSGYFRARSGRHAACLSESTAANFDLYLQQWNGRRWQTVARGEAAGGADAADGTGGTERLTFNGDAGYYRYRIVSVTGSGSFLLGADVP